VNNPQFRVVLEEKTHLQIWCEAEEINEVQLMLYEGGVDATETPYSSIIANKN
jgi:hypothetical protein